MDKPKAVAASDPHVTDSGKLTTRDKASSSSSLPTPPASAWQPIDSQEQPMDRRTTGLIDKFRVERTDGTSGAGLKHDGCEYFVLDMTHDFHARAALVAYAASCEADYPALAADLREKARMVGYGNLNNLGGRL
jgi:hypothetical protein